MAVRAAILAVVFVYGVAALSCGRRDSSEDPVGDPGGSSAGLDGGASSAPGPPLDAAAASDTAREAADAPADVGSIAAAAPTPPPGMEGVTKDGVTLFFPAAGLRPEDVAVLIKADANDSVELGLYYARKHAIPDKNIIRLTGVGNASTVSATAMAAITAQLQQMTPPGIQAYVAAWTTPYRVECMSMATALADKFDSKWCSSTLTGISTAPTMYYASASRRPFDDFKLRPTMMLAASDAASARRCIDNGAAAESTFPLGKGYLVRTTDGVRSLRMYEFQRTVMAWNGPNKVQLAYVDDSMKTSSTQGVRNENDVLFYFTGLVSVPAIDTNTYRPGAVADHLTSVGGQVPTSGQMSIVKWIDAGVTGSYGTVVEPYAIADKFPNTSVFVPEYWKGATLVEAYWKSVRTPGQGNFVGDALARPWRPTFSLEAGALRIKTTGLVPRKTYAVESAPSATGPWTPIKSGITVPEWQVSTIEVPLPDATAKLYRLIEREAAL